MASGLQGWFNPSDPYVRDLYRFQEEFGATELVAIAFKDENLLSRDVLSRIDRLTRELGKLDEVETVTSLTNWNVLTAGGPFGLTQEPLIPSLPETEADVEILKKRVLADPSLRNLLVSEDGSAGAVLLFTKTRQERDKGSDVRKQLMTEVWRVARETLGPDREILISGGPPLEVELSRLAVFETAKFVPVVVAIVAVLLIIAFRSFYYMALTQLSILVSFIWTMGFFSLFGGGVNAVSTLLPPLAMILGVAYTVHIVVQYLEERDREEDPGKALERSLNKIAAPCLMSFLTTAVGLLSLLFNQSPIIREFGVFASFGVLFAYFNAVTLAPICLSLRPGPKRRRTAASTRGANLLDSCLSGVYSFNWKRRRLVLGISILAIIASLMGMRRLKVEANEMDMLREDNKVKRAFRFMEENMAGLNLMEMTLHRGDGAPLTDVETLQKIDRFERALIEGGNAKQTFSLLTAVKLLNMGLAGYDPKEWRVPSTEAEAERVVGMIDRFGGARTRNYANDNFTTLRVTARLPFLGSQGFREEMERAEKLAGEIFGADAELRFRGLMPLYVHLTDYIILSQIKSFAAVVVAIFLLLVVFQRSVYLSVIAMVPNVAPILTTFGLMGWLGIRLDIATAMIGSIAIGIAVDDTIHYLVRHKREYALHGDHDAACRAAILNTGRAIFLTSVILFFGFMCLAFSQFKPVFYFGLLTGLTMFSALLGDLYLLPALMLTLRPTLKNAASAASPANARVAPDAVGRS